MLFYLRLYFDFITLHKSSPNVAEPAKEITKWLEGQTGHYDPLEFDPLSYAYSASATTTPTVNFTDFKPIVDENLKYKTNDIDAIPPIHTPVFSNELTSGSTCPQLDEEKEHEFQDPSYYSSLSENKRFCRDVGLHSLKCTPSGNTVLITSGADSAFSEITPPPMQHHSAETSTDVLKVFATYQCCLFQLVNI